MHSSRAGSRVSRVQSDQLAIGLRNKELSKGQDICGRTWPKLVSCSTPWDDGWKDCFLPSQRKLKKSNFWLAISWARVSSLEEASPTKEEAPESAQGQISSKRIVLTCHGSYSQEMLVFGIKMDEEALEPGSDEIRGKHESGHYTRGAQDMTAT
ncbi:hypothetical protein RDABS01_025231 [Bienertia sinuspersici]